ARLPAGGVPGIGAGADGGRAGQVAVTSLGRHQPPGVARRVHAQRRQAGAAELHLRLAVGCVVAEGATELPFVDGLENWKHRLLTARDSEKNPFVNGDRLRLSFIGSAPRTPFVNGDCHSLSMIGRNQIREMLIEMIWAAAGARGNGSWLVDQPRALDLAS